MSRYVFLTMVVIATLILAYVAAALVVRPGGGVEPGIIRFRSYEELRSFVAKHMSSTRWEVALGGHPKPTILSAKEETTPYSQTNVQVSGVDEPDIVKTDGKYIYLASRGTVRIIRAYPPGKLAVESELKVSDVAGLFVYGDRLVVLSRMIQYRIYGIWGPAQRPSQILIYDVSSRSSPKLVFNLTFKGFYISSRMKGRYLYAVFTEPVVGPMGNRSIILLPSAVVNGEPVEIEPQDIVAFKGGDYYVYSMVAAVDVTDPAENTELRAALADYAGVIYMSLNNLYIASHMIGDKTAIYRVAVDGLNLSYKGYGVVPGHILNQFSLDEYAGYLRVATTRGYVAAPVGKAGASNNIYILRIDTMEIVGKLEGLGIGERIYSARFVGGRCYLVTFRKVDPFFVIDVSDPRNPKTLGWLKIPGYSNYLHPISENIVLGIGKEAKSTEDGFSWYQGLKISLFDVTNVSSPKEISRMVIGDRGTYSPVLWDHHAFTMDAEGRLYLPLLIAVRENPNAPPYIHGTPVWAGVYVINVSKNGLKILANLTQGPPLRSYVPLRVVYIGDYVYTISESLIKVWSRATFEQINELKI